MTGGTGKRNKRVRFTSFIDPANILLDAIDYNIEGMYSNAQGIEKENVISSSSLTALFP